jgi:hypothetical protein
MNRTKAFGEAPESIADLGNGSFCLLHAGKVSDHGEMRAGRAEGRVSSLSRNDKEKPVWLNGNRK